MAADAIFGDAFEGIWKEFDTAFKSELLEKVKGLGSLYRSTLSKDDLIHEMSVLFYDALEHSLVENGRLQNFREALADPLPKRFGEVRETLEAHAANPLHAFMLTMIYIQEHPFRAFFSGRDAALPLNTLTVVVEQRPDEKAPTAVRYGLSHIKLSHCAGLAFDPIPLADNEEEEHPKNHWWWDYDPKHDDIRFIWYWHF